MPGSSETTKLLLEVDQVRADRRMREDEDRAKMLFPDDIETGEHAEDVLPHLFDIWHFDVAPKFNHATRYIDMRYGESAPRVVSALDDGVPSVGRADDLLRTCRLYPAPLEDPLVREHLSHLTNGKKFKPVVLVRFVDGSFQEDLIDGYHRISVAWWCDAQMPCPYLNVVVR